MWEIHRILARIEMLGPVKFNTENQGLETKILGNNQFLPFDFKIQFLRAERKLEAVLRICWSHGFAFWFWGFTVCYHNSKSMLSIAFNYEKT